MPHPTWSWLFWLSLGFILYTYLGYPAILLAWHSLGRRRPPAAEPETPPFLSVILTVRNEAAHIRSKLLNLVDLDYPADRMEIWVASDGSTDDTAAIARSVDDPRIRVQEFEEPVGKSMAINRTVPLARGELLVLMDARQKVERDAFRAIAARFADPGVGAAGGEMIVVNTDGDVTSEGMGLYWRFERRVRALEADLEMLSGLSGCFFAIRREAFRPIPPGSYCEDVALVLTARSAGWKVRWAGDAHCYETLRSPRVEFGRKVRTLVGNYQLFTQFWPLYLPWRGRLAFTLISHKLCRLFIPLALLGVLASSAVLAFRSPWFALFLALQVLLYGVGVVGICSASSRRRLRLANVCSTFCMLNGAALLAFLHVLRHGPRIEWR